MSDAEFSAVFGGDRWEPDYGPDVVPIREGVIPAAGKAGPLATTSEIVATPYVLPDEESIPRRPWVYGFHLLRREISLDIAGGGIGKSTLKIGEAISMVTGRSLYGKPLPEGPLRVWLYNLEDNQDEIDRRIAGVCKFFNVSAADLTGRLFVDSGLDRELLIAVTTPNGVVINRPDTEALLAEVLGKKIDVLSIDPFVSSHQVNENDNMMIDYVVKKGLKPIAVKGNCAINVVHHITKSKGEAVTIDSSRGASSLVNVARSSVVYNRMTEAEAKKAEVDPSKRNFYFNVHDAKPNLAPPADHLDWYRMESVDLANGDKVGVARQFIWPAAEGFSRETIEACKAAVGYGQYRTDVQSKDWAGNVLADPLELDKSTPEGRSAIKIAMTDLIRCGAFKVVEAKDDKRNTRKYFQVATPFSEEVGQGGAED